MPRYGPPGRDTSAPSEPALSTGWNQVGDWGGYLGTPIAANFFLTTKHVGGADGVVALSPLEFLAPARRSRAAAAEAPTPVSRSIPAESQAQAGRDGTGKKATSASGAMPRPAGMGTIPLHQRLAERRRTQPWGRWRPQRPVNDNPSPANRLRNCR